MVADHLIIVRVMHHPLDREAGFGMVTCVFNDFSGQVVWLVHTAVNTYVRMLISRDTTGQCIPSSITQARNRSVPNF
jgi:hypothetical protein